MFVCKGLLACPLFLSASYFWASTDPTFSGSFHFIFHFCSLHLLSRTFFFIELPQTCVCVLGYVLDHKCDKSAFSHSESKLKRKLAYMWLFVGGTDWQATIFHANSQTQQVYCRETTKHDHDSGYVLLYVIFRFCKGRFYTSAIPSALSFTDLAPLADIFSSRPNAGWPIGQRHRK